VQAALELTLPIFALVFCGYAGRRFGPISNVAVEAINQFVFLFALPAMLFRVAASNPLDTLLDPAFAAAWLSAGLAIFGIAYAVGRKGLGGDRAQSAGWGLNAAHGNVGYMGIPLMSEIGGAKALAPILLIVILDVFIVITLTIALLELSSQRNAEGTPPTSKGRATPRDVARVIALGLARSPLVLAILIGLLWSASGWPLPNVLDSFTRLLGGVAGPCALFAIGASLGGNTIARGVARPLSVLAALKLIAHPVLAAAAFFWVFPVAPYPASIGVLAATLPSASNGFIVAQRYSLDVRSISAAIVVGTLVSLLTVSFAIWALKLH